MKTILKYYSLIVVTIMVMMGFLISDNISQLMSAILFYPLAVYLWMSVTPKSKKALTIPTDKKATKAIAKSKPKKKSIKKVEEEPEELALEGEPASTDKFDMDRRAFIKLIGSAGLSVFMLSLFTKRAQAAFFGSVPGPGVVAIKDSSGNQIDPAEKQPTDGYRVVQLDDSTPAYYGFQNASGAWYIMQEDASGNYRYAVGSSDFTNATTGWPNRAALSYDYFENVF